jgi:hypothetical protein
MVTRIRIGHTVLRNPSKLPGEKILKKNIAKIVLIIEKAVPKQ